MVHGGNCRVRMVGRFLLRNILAVGDILWAYFLKWEEVRSNEKQGRFRLLSERVFLVVIWCSPFLILFFMLGRFELFSQSLHFFLSYSCVDGGFHARMPEALQDHFVLQKRTPSVLPSCIPRIAMRSTITILALLSFGGVKRCLLLFELAIVVVFVMLLLICCLALLRLNFCGLSVSCFSFFGPFHCVVYFLFGGEIDRIWV